MPTTNTNSPLSSLTEQIKVDEKTLAHWNSLPAATFNIERATLCYSITSPAIRAWQQISPSTIQQALAMGTPTIGGLQNYSGYEATLQTIIEMVTTAALLMNVGKNLHKGQVEPVARLLLDNPEYRLFTVADFRLALNRGVMGKYGATYDRFDITVICNWLDQYWNERLEECEKKSPATRMEKTVLPNAVKVLGETFEPLCYPVTQEQRQSGVEKRWDLFSADSSGRVGVLAQWQDGRFAFLKVGMTERVILSKEDVEFEAPKMPDWFTAIVQKMDVKKPMETKAENFLNDRALVTQWQEEWKNWDTDTMVKRPSFENYCIMEAYKLKNSI